MCHRHTTNELSPIVDVLDLPTDKVAVSDKISGWGSQFLQVPSLWVHEVVADLQCNSAYTLQEGQPHDEIYSHWRLPHPN